MKTYVDEIGSDVRYMELAALANMPADESFSPRPDLIALVAEPPDPQIRQTHYSETPLGSVLRQWETADMMKHVPTDWTLPVAISAALYNNNTLSAGPTDPCAP